MIRSFLMGTAMATILCAGAFAQELLPETDGTVIVASQNVFQQILGATRIPGQQKSLTIENNNLTGNCWVNITQKVPVGTLLSASIGGGKTAANVSIYLPPGGSFGRYYPYIPSGLLVGTCDTPGNSIYLTTQ